MLQPTIKARIASVSGILRHHRPGIYFRGIIKLELRVDCVYYTWRLEAEDGEFLGYLARPVSKKIVPEGSDSFEFALAHAIEGIRRYRFGRVRPFEIQSWEWAPP